MAKLVLSLEEKDGEVILKKTVLVEGKGRSVLKEVVNRIETNEGHKKSIICANFRDV